MKAEYRWEQLKNRFSAPVGQALVKARDDDGYLAAYPRSGSTWLRTMLVNLVDDTAQGNPDVFNKRFPAMSIRNSQQINRLESPRLIMTHGLAHRKIQKVVYLVRDGRDCFISGFYYHSHRAGRDLSLEDYWQLYRRRVFGKRWHEHVMSWLADEHIPLQIMVMKFENLKDNTHEELGRAATFLGVAYSKDSIESAIKMASLDHARKIESQQALTPMSNDQSFYRGGESQQWRKDEHRVWIKRFIEEEGAALDFLSYK